MPRIDPLQLLKCLGVLLTPEGGIRSKEEVQRLASLMMKFSKKLVSKCVYILILKNTDIELLGMFMSAGGWTLVLTWLSDGIYGKNWALVIELLELLLMCPVDVERLKSNSIPRLVKGLSKDEGLGRVNYLATKLVDQWLKIVKDETVSPEKEVPQSMVVVKSNEIVVEMPEEIAPPEPVEEVTVNSKIEAVSPNQLVVMPQQFYKVTVRDGKQIIAKVDSLNLNVGTDKPESPSELSPKEAEEVVAHAEKKDKEKRDEDRKLNKDRSKHEKSRYKSSSSAKSSSNSTSKDKNSSSSSSSLSSSKNKVKDRERSKDRHRDRDKHRSNGSIKHSSNSSSSNSAQSSGSSTTSKESKEKQAEKDKDTLAKIQPKSVDKFGRIPKKSSSGTGESGKSDKSEKKTTEAAPEPRTKPSISIEVRKKDGSERPKTVKVFNSKLRSTGLEEAAKPPPPRPATKKSPVLPVLPVKRLSPPRDPLPLPEKRVKLVEPELEKPGGIKLIAAKPKPPVLQESDMFMDALTASATNKKEPKKRKRRISKDNSLTITSPPASPSSTATNISPLSPPLSLKSITAPKFYKDTLETDESKAEDSEDNKNDNEETLAKNIASEPKVETESTENVVKEVNGLRGVLVYHKRRKIKKSVAWRPDAELEEVQYFELDENERVNVTKTFMDMKQMEHVGEREALQLSRKLPNEDLMDERTNWKPLIPIDLPPPLAEPGKKSTEKDIQFAREKVILQALYFNRSMLPDSAAEPDPEHHQITDPIPIPLDDVTGNPDSINDFQNTPWPEPKGSPLHTPTLTIGTPHMYPTIPAFNPQMGPPGYNAMGQPYNNSSYIPPHMMNNAGGGGNGAAGDWRGAQDPAPMQTDVIHAPVNPGMFNNRPDGYVNMIDESGSGGTSDMGGRGNGGGAGGYPPPGFAPGPMSGPPGPPGPMYPNYSGNGRGGSRGGFRNMSRGGWFRPGGPPPGWHRGAASNHWGGRGGGGVCHQFKMHGFCRQRETCPYMHPQGNGPY